MRDLLPEADRTSVETACRSYLEQTKAAILDRLIHATPEFFESVVVDLLIALKYGKSGEITGKSGDGGVDGVVYDDRLGFDRIHIQAKRWTYAVGRPELQAFFGALHGVGAKKGVFITTSTFTKPAYEYVKTLPIVVVLIDGIQLADLMYEANVGVSTTGVFEIKAIDTKYFDRK